jgi:hypothetical protein
VLAHESVTISESNRSAASFSSGGLRLTKGPAQRYAIGDQGYSGQDESRKSSFIDSVDDYRSGIQRLKKMRADDENREKNTQW